MLRDLWFWRVKILRLCLNEAQIVCVVLYEISFLFYEEGYFLEVRNF